MQWRLPCRHARAPGRGVCGAHGTAPTACRRPRSGLPESGFLDTPTFTLAIVLAFFLVISMAFERVWAAAPVAEGGGPTEHGTGRHTGLLAWRRRRRR